VVTGHTGFKGSWLCEWLLSLGAEVTGLALEPDTTPSLFEQLGLRDRLNDVVGDIRSQETVSRVLAAAKPDFLFHMAAQPLVRRSYREPVETWDTNVLGTIHVMEALRRLEKPCAAVCVTTDKCYENNDKNWAYRENDRLGGHDPYSNSKACSELVTASFRSSYFDENKYQTHGVALATARAGNVIGGGDWAENRLVPDILKSFESGQAVSVRNPNAIRPWQHVLEPLRGYIQLAQKLVEYGPKYGQAWNFGPQPHDAKPVSWIVREMCQKWGLGASWVNGEGGHIHEANFLKLDVSKSAAQLEWEPQIDLDQALKLIIDWHRAFVHNEDMKEFTLHQISQYQQLSN
jgi:CDP-glucose 4,6-dehydratase